MKTKSGLTTGFPLGFPKDGILADVACVPRVMSYGVSKDCPVCLAFGKVLGEDVLTVQDCGCSPLFLPKVADEQSFEIRSGLPGRDDMVHGHPINDNDWFSIGHMDELVGDSQ